MDFDIQTDVTVLCNIVIQFYYLYLFIAELLLKMFSFQ